jgi:Recombination endonuclease VII
MPRKPTRARALGVTDEEYARLLAAQGGHCALCPNEPKTRRLHVDHDHATGRVRGLLCHRCNRNLPTWVTPEWGWAVYLYLLSSRDLPGRIYVTKDGVLRA